VPWPDDDGFTLVLSIERVLVGGETCLIARCMARHPKRRPEKKVVDA
jgi:hypothetical protein